jgi:nucleoside-diphosphate-sugar epimerase
LTTFGVTGGTGLLGNNLILEIIKNNIENLDNIRILWFGRSARQTLKERIKNLILTHGWQYINFFCDEVLMDKILSVIIPIELDFRNEKIKIDQESYNVMAEKKIDYFFHIAAITDLRNNFTVEKYLTEVIFNGTKQLFELIDSLPEKVGKFVYVSSAYVCGKTYGKISADYINFNQEFRNPYEKIKLQTEHICRAYCKKKNVPLKVFRPTILGGRIIERPIGHVTKYEVFYSWAAFFVELKRKILSGLDWKDVFETPIEIPIRIYFNPESGLNIVASDFCAKVMYAATTRNNSANSYHLASLREMPNLDLLHSMMEIINIDGWSIADRMPDNLNNYEKLYYRTVGSIYTQYVSGDSMLFDTSSMLDVCQEANIPVVNIDIDNFKLMMKYAVENRFGLLNVDEKVLTITGDGKY